MNHSWRATAYDTVAPHAIGAISSTSHGDKWVAVVCERANSCRAHDLGLFDSLTNAQRAVEAKIDELAHVEATGNSVIHQLTPRGRIRCGYTSTLPTAVHNGGLPVSCPSCLTGAAA